MHPLFMLILNKTVQLSMMTEYIVGAIIALFILCYLLLYFIRPDKF
jgi:hypothetical protein